MLFRSHAKFKRFSLRPGAAFLFTYRADARKATFVRFMCGGSYQFGLYVGRSRAEQVVFLLRIENARRSVGASDTHSTLFRELVYYEFPLLRSALQFGAMFSKR